MSSQLRRLRRAVIGCACLLASGGLHAQTAPAPARPPVATWLQRIERLAYPDNVTADWQSLPAAAPGVTAALARALGESQSPTVRLHAARALGEMRFEPAAAVPALCRALADDDEAVRAQAFAAVRSFGGAAQAGLWAAAADFRQIKTGGSSPPRVADFAVAALAGLEGLDPRPLFEEYRAAVKRGRWRERATGGAAASDADAEFLGSTEHLASVLDAVFERADRSAVAALGVFLADDNEHIRKWTRDALARADDISAVLPQVRARWGSADASEKESLVEIFARGGASALPDLFKLVADNYTAAATRRDIGDTVSVILASQPLADLLDGWKRFDHPEARGLLLEAIIVRAAQGGAPPAWQPAIADAAAEAMSDPKTRGAALAVLQGNIRVAIDGRMRPFSDRPQLDLPPALARALALAEVKLYPACPAEQQHDLLAAIGVLRTAAHSETLADALRKILAAAEGETRETVILVLTAIGAPPPELVKWLATADAGNFGELLPLLDPQTELGAAALTAIVRRGADDEEIAAKFSSPAFWRLLAASKNPAETARGLHPIARVRQLEADVNAVLAEHGNESERKEARRQLTAELLDLALQRWDSKLAEAVVRFGDAEAKNQAIERLADGRGDDFPSVMRAALARRDDNFPWEEKLIAAMPEMSARGFHDAQLLLLESEAGRTALVKAVTDNHEFLLKALEHLDEVPAKSDKVIEAVQKLAQQLDEQSSLDALSVLARLAPADPRSRDVWVAALRDEHEEVRRKAIDALELAAMQEPALHPLWLAAATRERGLSDTEACLRAGVKGKNHALAAWKAARPPPPTPTVKTATTPETNAGAWRLSPEEAGKAAADPAQAPALARTAALAHPAEAAVIAASFTLVARESAAPIAAAVAGAHPPQAAMVAAIVAAIAPSSRNAIIAAVAEATHQTLESVQQQVATAAGGINAVATSAMAAVSTSGYGQNTQTATPPQTTSPAMEEFQQFAFPWPPPPPVVWDTFRDGPNEPLNRRWLGNDDTTLEEVNSRLRAALRAISPEFVSGLFPVPGGFALVTRIERIHRGGEPFHGTLRWSDGDSLKPDWPTYMFYERSGYFRKIVFAVTTDANIRPVAGRKIPPPESGAKNLPREVGQLTLKDRYVHVLVYAFEKIPEGPYVAFTELSAPRHVESTGLLAYLKPPPSR